jgi:hypothetical protein
VVSATGSVTSAFWTPTITVSEPNTPADGAYTGLMTSSAF